VLENILQVYNVTYYTGSTIIVIFCLL